jgi:ribosomal protein L11 methyltransferase
VSEIRLYVSTTEPLAEQVLEALSGMLGEEDYAIATQEIDEERGIWEASIYMPLAEEPAMRARLDDMISAQFPTLAIAREVLPDIDWITKSLEGLKPVRAGRFLVHGSHDADKVRTSDIGILIDAGQAFGTGHHGTTAGCLNMIGDVLKSRRVMNALDLGTGSGVLAIATYHIAKIPVLATDIDPVAVRGARDNVRVNRAASGIHLATAPGFHHPVFKQFGPFDLIIANILARPLMKLAPDVVRHLSDNGTVILSGILSSQRWKVIAAYNTAGLKHRRTTWMNGWVTIELTRN